jgi:cell division septation protein DedD
MRRKTKLATLVALVVVVLAAGLTAAACGGSSSSDGGSATTKDQQIKAYLRQMSPVYNQISAALKSADDAVAGLSARPDATWKKASAHMKTAATQLGSAVSTLQGVAAPSNAKAAQENAVKALQNGQKTLQDIGGYLAAGTYDPSRPLLKTQIKDAVAAALQQLFSIMMDEAHSLSPAATKTTSP